MYLLFIHSFFGWFIACNYLGSCLVVIACYCWMYLFSFRYSTPVLERDLCKYLHVGFLAMLLDSIPAKGPWLWWVKARREGSVPDGPVTWVQFYENANGNGMGGPDWWCFWHLVGRECSFNQGLIRLGIWNVLAPHVEHPPRTITHMLLFCWSWRRVALRPNCGRKGSII